MTSRDKVSMRTKFRYEDATEEIHVVDPSRKCEGNKEIYLRNTLRGLCIGLT